MLTVNLPKYIYKNTKEFIRAPLNHHSMMNFKGEIYEASFYEAELEKLSNLSDKEFRIVAKGPYSTERDSTITKTGFHTTKDGSLILYSNSIPLAEFDCLKIGENLVKFYECTLTQKPENLKVLQQKALRKTKLLKQFFPEKDIQCIIVGNSESTLKYFEKTAVFDTLHHTLPEVDLLGLAKNTKPQKIRTTLPLISPKDLNKEITNFDYLQELTALCSSVFEDASILPVKEKIILSDGLFARLYWGKIITKDYEVNNKSNEMIVAVNFLKINSPKIRYYFTKDNGQSFYEAASKPKKLNHWKSSRVELIKINSKLPIRTKQDFAKLTNELADWCDNWLKA